jgi:nucleoside-triphosphatase THEP1
MRLRKHGSPNRQIVILTGERGTGKTTTCGRLLRHGRELGLDCAGVLCPARFDGETKVGIDVVDARTQERRRLAEVDELPARLRAGPYRFDDEAVAWGVAQLGMACPCDVLIVDEIGPLEMDRGEGWVNAVDVLRAREYRLAVAVVRPSLVEAVRMAVGDPRRAPGPRCVAPGPGAVQELLSLVLPTAGSPSHPA